MVGDLNKKIVELFLSHRKSDGCLTEDEPEVKVFSIETKNKVCEGQAKWIRRADDEVTESLFSFISFRPLVMQLPVDVTLNT